MKKIILSVAVLAMIFGATFLSSCSKDDTTPPVITLKGAATIQDTLNKAYVELGATATDNKDGDLTTSIVTSGTVNYNLKGTYTITYTVSDAAGNTATATRTVNVINTAEFVAGTYAVTDTWTGSLDTTESYNVVVSTSTTTNNAILMADFGGFGTPVIVNATISGTNLTIPPQSPTGISPTALIANGLNGYGTINTISGILHVNYTADWGGSPDYAISASCGYARTSKKK